MRPGDFAVVKSSGPIAWIIRLVEESSWTHVRSATTSASYLDPVWPIIEEKVGILESSPKSMLISPDLTGDERLRIAQNLRGDIGKPYGIVEFIWAGFTILIPPLRKIRDPLRGGLVCSTTVAWAYWNAGCYDKLNVGKQDPDSVTPADLAVAYGASWR